jgi:hypothetical protein
MFFFVFFCPTTTFSVHVICVNDPQADSSIAMQNGKAEAEAYERVKHELGFNNDELLRYIWWDSIGSTSNKDADVLVGISPSTLLRAQN